MRDISPESPEARRKRLARAKAHFGTIRDRMPSRSRAWEVIKRVAIGVYSDGFIHAGNLAYLALFSLFPFVIVAAAIARLFGATAEGMDAVNALLLTMPPNVAEVLRLKGKGFTGKNGQRGDQLATLMVEVPDDPELANFLEGWSKRGQTNPRAALGV